MINKLSVAIHVFPMRRLKYISIDEILLPRYVKWSTNLRSLLLNVEMDPSCLKHRNLFYVSLRCSQILLAS